MSFDLKRFEQDPASEFDNFKHASKDEIAYFLCKWSIPYKSSTTRFQRAILVKKKQKNYLMNSRLINEADLDWEGEDSDECASAAIQKMHSPLNELRWS